MTGTYMKCNTGLSWVKDLKMFKNNKLVNGIDLFLVGKISQALLHFHHGSFFLPSLISQSDIFRKVLKTLKRLRYCLKFLSMSVVCF